MSAFSKYSLEVMLDPYVSSSFREKSRTTQRKEGKYFAISSGSHSPTTSDLICNSLDRFIYGLINRLGGIYDQRKVVNRILVNGAHAVVDKVRRQQQSQQEYLSVMVLVLIEGSYSLAVDQEDFELFALVLRLKRLSPNPEAFGARVDGGSNSEPLSLLVDDDAVQQEGLACPVLSCHGDHTHTLLDP